MPSIRKRIGYLPSTKAQEKIIKIANKEKLSQSKVVGILVEEALKARAGFSLKKSNNSNKNNFYGKKNMDSSACKYSDIDELISDKGIVYNTKKYKLTSDDSLSENVEEFNEELFEQFKQFILFQKSLQNK